jgi:hypothetical protein
MAVTAHLAQVNIALIKGPLDGPIMAGFVKRLDDINALADRSPGFVWRLQTGDGNAIYVRPFDDDRIIANLSVWQTVEQLHEFVYKSAHAPVMRRRQEWFSKFQGAYVALWWVPEGHVPSIDEAKQRLARLDQHGPTSFAFTFKDRFPVDEALLRATDWSAFAPCPEAKPGPSTSSPTLECGR